MATLLSSRSFLSARSSHSKCRMEISLTLQSALNPAIRRTALSRLQDAQREQRSLNILSPQGIPVSGPGSPSIASASGGVEGQVTAELMNSMRAKICEALETDTCIVSDVYGDGRHVSIEVVSKLFVDKSSMQRQRMVYKAIWLELQEAVHAVDSMSTKTPEEAAQ